MTVMAHSLFHHHSLSRRSRTLCQKGSSATTSVDKTRISSVNNSCTRGACTEDRSAEKTHMLRRTQNRSVPVRERKASTPVGTSDIKPSEKRLSLPTEMNEMKRCSGTSARDPPNGILQPGADAKSILRNFSAASYRTVALASEDHAELQPDPRDQAPTDWPRHFAGSSRHLAGLLWRSLDSQTVVKHSLCRPGHSLNSGSCRYRVRLNSTPAARKQVTFDDNITFLHHSRHRRHSTSSLLFD